MKTLKAIIICILILLGWSKVATTTPISEIESVVLHVKPGENGDCSSWTSACELQTAIFNADSGEQIWVAAGTYYPTDDFDREATFTLKAGVAIYGGFPADGGNWSQRDWETNTTTLSGDIGIVGNSNDNSYHVATGSGVDITAVLDGFTISLGNANGTSPNNGGGGMYNTSSSPSLTNVTFSDNSAEEYGGGMFNVESSPSLTNVTFAGNSATGDYGNGGGMHNRFDSSPTLTNVIFSGNTAYFGGGMSNYFSSSPTLTNVTFSSNSAGYAGGMANYFSSSPTLTNVTFSDNSATYDIGGGGGMYNYDSYPSLTYVTFSGNTATESGGGMYNYESSPTLTNVTFSANEAIYGGGMYNEYYSSPSLTNVTFSANEAIYGGGMYSDESIPTVTNSILWGNTAGQISGSGATVTYSAIQGNDVYPGMGNINEDPFLGILADNGGFTQTHAITTGSPAIDTGDPELCPNFDQRGYPRPIDGDGDGQARCDMGAYEYGSSLLYLFLPLIVK